MKITLPKDSREFIELLLSQKVEFLLVGGYALAFHGAPRFTEDIDLFVMVSPQNADRIIKVLDDFGFGGIGITSADFLEPDQVIQLGRTPHRIDLLTGISGVDWETAWSSRIEADLDGLTVPAIGKAALEANKKATGRPQDLADLARMRQSE
ncbi:MAG: nucleotidyl transferase AbiEii/AbiGii toxin family protein [Verrucomicrobia bacterium]|nr:nucleotidyl transferase AbiEii/AbiGii toxin family protein [Verrucomicrobiota bacterium]MDA1006264.1 nucleotidyl transferase AbiEii/AbiGii toxin family protein [Verrucomicrobiota bacterium]